MARAPSLRKARWLEATPVRATAVDARGPGLRGPTAVGALAVGASALGAVAIGRLAVGRAAIKHLVIDDLEIGRLRGPGLAAVSPPAVSAPAVSGDPRQRALDLLGTRDHMTVATADESGKPWASPVQFAQDEDHNLYWVSSRSSTHSESIRRRPEVGIVIYATDPVDALHLDARAEELEDEAEIARALELLARRPQPERFTASSPDDVTGDAAWRVYRATPTAAFVREDALEGGQAVSRRRPVELG